jgi:5-methylcytosine-specific restriction protein A
MPPNNIALYAPRPPQDIRPSAAKRGYNRTWNKVRAVKLVGNPLCEECLKAGIVKQAEEVHHIKPVAEFPELRLAIDNLQSLCRVCHNKKTAEEKRNRKKEGEGGVNP